MNRILSLGLLSVLVTAVAADTCKVLDTTILKVGKDAVQVVTEACTGSGLLSARGPPWHEPEQLDARKSCGVPCDPVCGPGQELPPAVEQCQEIKDAIENHFYPFEDTFVLSPGQKKTMTYKTCSFSFTNDGPSDVEYCYSELSDYALETSIACFHSTGTCSSKDGMWTIRTFPVFEEL